MSYFVHGAVSFNGRRIPPVGCQVEGEKCERVKSFGSHVVADSPEEAKKKAIESLKEKFCDISDLKANGLHVYVSVL